MPNALVRLENISKSYWRDALEIPVLRNLTFEIPEGEFLALMGPSGSGKTTLLNLIAGIDRPSGGRLFVGREEISQMSEAALARWRSRTIGFIFQFYNLIPVLTAFENVELPLFLTDLRRSERRRQVLRMVEFHAAWRPMCFNCAGQMHALLAMPATIEALRKVLGRERRANDRRADRSDT
nr:ATP-binding cassette domain-containing protein [candidate division Zixibacteria bacterium]